MTLVALIEREPEVRRRYVHILEGGDFAVAQAGDALEAIRTAFQQRPDAAVVRLNEDAQQLIQILRAACDIPIVALTSGAASVDIVRALDAGADDVVEEGCQATEFLARLRAAIRRYERRATAAAPARKVTTGSLVIDRDAQQVTRQGRQVILTRTEYRLLDALAARVGETAPHRYLLSTVWGDAYVDDTHYLRVYIGYLRNKLEDDPARPRYLINEWGIGYRLATLPLERAESLDEPWDTSRVAQYVAV